MGIDVDPDGEPIPSSVIGVAGDGRPVDSLVVGGKIAAKNAVTEGASSSSASRPAGNGSSWP